MGFVLSHCRYKYAEWQGCPFRTSDIIKSKKELYNILVG